MRVSLTVYVLDVSYFKFKALCSINKWVMRKKGNRSPCGGVGRQIFVDLLVRSYTFVYTHTSNEVS